MDSCQGLAFLAPKVSFEFTKDTGEREEGDAGCQSEDISLRGQIANQKSAGSAGTKQDEGH